MSTINTIPAKVRTTIYQGSPWPGVKVRYVDTNGTPETITVTADVATAVIPDGGVWLAACDIGSADGDGYRSVSLDATATAALPARQVLIDVMVTRSGGEPSVAMRVTADVEAAIPAEPAGP